MASTIHPLPIIIIIKEAILIDKHGCFPLILRAFLVPTVA